MMPVIRCVTMQKNERALLEPWLLYHAALFGFSALTVIDNGSDDPHVLRTLARYERRGVTVLRDYPTPADFGRKGAIVTDVLRAWDREGGYDFGVPLDCDEFLVALKGRFAWDRDAVLSAFGTLMGHRATFLNDRVLLNVPQRPGYFRAQIISRTVVAAGSIVSLDRGFHSPQTIYPDRWIRAPLACVHLHNRPSFADIRRAARQKLHHLIGDADPAEIAPTGESVHLYSYFRTTEEMFLEQYRDVPDLYVPGILAHFETLGIDWKPLLGSGGIHPSISSPTDYLVHCARESESRHIFDFFDEAFYARSNPDVTGDSFFGRWPLVHFLTAGWAEGRAPNSLPTPPVEIEGP